MNVWLATYDCGDYYHDGEHIVGVFATEDDGHAAVRAHEQKDRPHIRYTYSVYEVTVGEREPG